MTARRLVIACAAVLGAVLMWMVAAGGRTGGDAAVPPSGATPAEPPSGAQRVRADPEPLTPAPAAVIPPSVPASAAGSFEVVVVVRGEDREPVSGATVELRPFEALQSLDETPWWQSAETDEDGRVALRVTQQRRYQVRARTGGRASLPRNVDLSYALTESVELRVGIASTLTAVVLRRDGSRVPGARVNLQLQAATGSPSFVIVATDEDGAFTVAGVPHAMLHSVHARATVDGRELVDRNLSADEIGLPPHLSLVETAAELRCRFIDESGAPVACAEVYLDPAPAGYRRPPSDAAGRFVTRTHWQEEPRPWPVFLSLPGYAHAVRVLPAPDAAGVIDLGDVTLVRGRTLTGRVVHTDGSPTVGAELVLLTPPAIYRLIRLTTQTDEAGEFTLRHVGPGRHVLVSKERDVWYLPGTGGSRGVEDADNDLSIVVPDWTLLRVRCRPASGGEWGPGVTLGARVLDAATSRLLAAELARSPPDGLLEFKLAGAGVVHVEVAGSDDHGGFSFHDVRIEGPGPIELEAVLGPAGDR